MSSQLHQVQNWPELARKSNWRAASLAKNCRVSLRMLQRFFKENMGISPKKWLFEQRQKHAVKLSSKPDPRIKVTATDLGYKYPCHFSRDFKKHWGISPTQINQSSQGA